MDIEQLKELKVSEIEDKNRGKVIVAIEEQIKVVEVPKKDD